MTAFYFISGILRMSDEEMKIHINILRIMASVMKTVYKPLLLPAYFIILFYILLCQHFCEFFILSLHSKEEVLFLIKRLEKHPFNQMKILTWLVSPTSVAIKKKSEHNYFSKNAKLSVSSNILFTIFIKIAPVEVITRYL